MHCSSLFAPFLAYVVPSFYPIFYCILCPVPCLRLCLRKVAQVSLSAAEHPGHLISHTFPPHFAPFVPALLSSCLAFFLLCKKENEAEVCLCCTPFNLLCSAPPLLVCMYFCNLINTVSEVRSWSPRRDPKLFGCLLNLYKFNQAPGKHTRSRSPLPSPRHQTRCALYPLPPHSLHAHFVMNALMPNHWSHSLDSGSFT